ncbi:MAG: MBL fold metallo-hydrolase [Isosphaeraceae bacterium]|nr:MBL fold metallo-hydrolase [Isosphaeraceae bacterium]
MTSPPPNSELLLVNGSTGDPVLFIDFPGRNNALLFDAGENAALGLERLGDLEAVFITHHHVDHFIGFDRIVRANLDRDKTLRVFGPIGTIRKVYNRITSYEYPFFPFQQLVLKVHEILPGRLRSALLEYARRFPEPEVRETSASNPVIYETDDLSIEAEPVDHTVPCLAFALVEKPGIQPDPDRLAAGPLRPGPWVGQVLGLLRSGAPAETLVTIEGRPFPLGRLAERYFAVSSGSRSAYVTDTAWSEAARPGLLRLAHRARRLYCDSFYAQAQHEQAEKYRHMTATQAAEFARLAEVEELVLIHFATRYQGQYETLVEEARRIFPRTSAEIPPARLNKERSGANGF